MKNTEFDKFISNFNKYKSSLKKKVRNNTTISLEEQQLLITLIDKLNYIFNNLYIKDYLEVLDFSRILDNLSNNIKKINFINIEKNNFGNLSHKKNTLFLNRNIDIDDMLIFYYKSIIKACRTTKKIEGFSTKKLHVSKNNGANVLNDVTAQDIAEEMFYTEKNFERLEIPYIPNKMDKHLDLDFYYCSNLKYSSMFQPLAIEFMNMLLKKKYRTNSYKRLMRDLNKLSFEENIGEIIEEKFTNKNLENKYLEILNTFDYLVRHKNKKEKLTIETKKIATDKIIEVKSLIKSIKF